MIISPKTIALQSNLDTRSDHNGCKIVYACNTSSEPKWIHIVSNDFELFATNPTGTSYQRFATAGAVTHSTTINFDFGTEDQTNSLFHEQSNSTTAPNQKLITKGYELKDSIIVESVNITAPGEGSVVVSTPVTIPDNQKIYLGPAVGRHTGSIVIPADSTLLIEKEETDKVFATNGVSIISGKNDGNHAVFFTGVK